jgi:Ca2+-binding EF-hand superfamily protein
MKKTILAAAALAALAATGAAAQQGQGPRQAQPLTRAAVEARVDAAFARSDADRDGFISQEEARARAEAFRAERPERQGQRREARAERRAERFARLDADRDGSISRAEFEAAPALGGDRAGRREARMERRASRHGLRANRGGIGGGMFARLGLRQFEAADANRDGRVSREEARSGALALFARVDTDRDGTISLEERRAAREAMGHRRGQGRRG